MKLHERDLSGFFHVRDGLFLARSTTGGVIIAIYDGSSPQSEEQRIFVLDKGEWQSVVNHLIEPPATPAAQKGAAHDTP